MSGFGHTLAGDPQAIEVPRGRCRACRTERTPPCSWWMPSKHESDIHSGTEMQVKQGEHGFAAQENWDWDKVVAPVLQPAVCLAMSVGEIDVPSLYTRKSRQVGWYAWRRVGMVQTVWFYDVGGMCRAKGFVCSTVLHV